MTEKYNQSTFNRIRRSKTVRAGALLLGLAVAGCGASGSPSTSASKAGKATPVAVGTRSPGTTAPTPASSAPTPETGTSTPRANWCKAASAIVESAFVDPDTASECEVMPASSTPGDVLIKWTLNSAGVTGYLVEASVLNFPFSQVTSGAKPTTTSSGAEVVVVPNSTQMYVKMAGNETGELQVLTGEGGAIPLGVDNSLTEAAGIFGVFGSTNPYELAQ